MNFPTFILILTVSCSLICAGFLLNAFIVIQSFIWWLKGKTLQTADIIMTSLGVVRIVLLTAFLRITIEAIAAHSVLPNKNTSAVYMTGMMSVAFCSLWWGTVLCVFYCVKITSYSNRLFMRLKMNISRMVPWVLLTSLLVSFLSSLPNIWCMYPGRYMNSTQDSYSSSIGNGTVEANYVNVFIVFLSGSIAPFLIFCAGICLLIASLLKHTRNMSSKDSGFTNTQLDVHISVIRNMVSFLLFYALYFITGNVMFLNYTEHPSYVLICSTCASAYPSLHSIMLIASNAKLKRSLLAALLCAVTSNPNDQMP
ncbi:taste receptor type 2 member 39-like [Pseudophryne corroboree]|uniref:taste receptor type 2 member 39-like n=1 Tax=Pseudophryne corroboree TaxID=495146 RepID=UPI0030819F02